VDYRLVVVITVVRLQDMYDAFPGLVQEPTCQVSAATEATPAAATTTTPTERRREDGQWRAVVRFLGHQEQVVGRSDRLQVLAAEQQQQQQQHEPQLDYELAALVSRAAFAPSGFPGRRLHQAGGHLQPLHLEQRVHLEPRLH
jgi:hypothetical protein